MQHIVFLMYHGQGHFNPMLRPAKILREKYRVTFAGFSFFKTYVTSQGFDYYPLHSVPFGLGFESWVNTIEKKRWVYLNSIRDRWSNRLYEMRKKELLNLLNTLQPDFLLIDSTQSTDFIVLYPELKRRRIRTALIHANLAIEVVPDLPPLNSVTLPGRAQEVKRAQRALHRQQLTRSILQWLKYLSPSDRAIVHRQIRKSKIPSAYVSPRFAILSPAIDNIEQLIFAPREFDFPSAFRSPRQHFLGFMIDRTRLENEASGFGEAFDQIKANKPAPLIYCSFGTVSYDETTAVKNFLTKLIAVTGRMNFQLLVSGTATELISDKPLPSHVHAFRFVPNLQVLPITAVFVNHGGFNSVKEAISASVPLLVYPIDKRTDQRGNAARVVYHGVGLMGDINVESKDIIAGKIARLITEPSFRTNASKLMAFDSQYTKENLLEAVGKITAPSA